MRRDRRDDYGESAKSFRKNIPRDKRFPHRANANRDHQILVGALGAADDRLSEGIEERLCREAAQALAEVSRRAVRRDRPIHTRTPRTPVDLAAVGPESQDPQDGNIGRVLM